MFKDYFFSFLCFLGRWFLSLRYEIEIKGKDEFKKLSPEKKGGTLVLPNHPAHLDPLIVVFCFWPILKMRPLVIEYMYRKPVIHFFMNLVKALPIPDFESSINDVKIQKGEEVLKEIKKGLKQNKSFMLYPAGRLKHGGKEIIGGASSTHDLLQEYPNTNIVLLRTVGLWGSIFSRALTSRTPDFRKNFFQGIKIALKNAIFFIPRRKVVIDVRVNPEDFPRKESRLDLNRYLENWYNQYPSRKVKNKLLDSEPMVLVSYSFYRKDYPKVEEIPAFRKKTYQGKISVKKKREIYKYLAELVSVNTRQIKSNMNLALDLGLDSLDLATVVSFLTDHYDTGNIHPEDLETVQDVLEIAEGRLKGFRSEPVNPKHKWPQEKKRPRPTAPEGDTLIESFFLVATKMKGFSACADDIVGVLSYSKLKKSILILAAEFQKKPGKYQGILLPASVGAYICIFACLLAGKIPVMLNWTLGSRFLSDMMKMTKVKTVYSSWKFLERLSHVELGDSVKNNLTLLEDLKKRISIFSKLKGVFLSTRRIKAILKTFSYKAKPSDPAVILFTSGTEATPKAVPLSHENIIKNQQAAFQCVQLYPSDVILGILPPFHSFGFSVAGIFSFLAGLKIAFFPDPTDSFAVLSSIKRWRATLFCGAPSFVLGVLQAGSAKDLQTVRLFVSGAEKAPKSLLAKIEKLGKKTTFIEGYGITECAPMISLNRTKKKRVGVGEPLPGIEICTVHPETLKLLEKGREGELCVRGPNVFQGYLGKAKSPFITLKKKKWYRTGDLGYLDKSGNLVLSGRLKRFTKVGGEMISLGGIEEVINYKLVTQKDLEEGPQLAICVDEKDETKSSLILFTTFDLSKAKVNEILKEEGFSRLVKINQVKKVDHIPLLGAGKTDYRKLQSFI